MSDILITPGEDRDLTQRRIAASPVAVLGYVGTDGKIHPTPADKPLKVLQVTLSTTTGGNINIAASIAALLTLLNETDPLELNKYTLHLIFCTDISSDAQGSDSFRMGFTNAAGSGYSYRPTWYGGGGVYGKHELAGEYTQFGNGIWILADSHVHKFYFSFPQWGAGETHSGLLRVELWKVDVETEAISRSS